MKTRLSLLIACFLAGCALTTRGGETPAPAPYPEIAGNPSADAGNAAPALPPLEDAGDVDANPVRPPITGDCGMEDLQHFVGEPRVNVPRNAMPENYRVVGPDTPVTMDYRPDRLTIRVNENDIVESMACG
ncbi:MAG: hypothetical protein CMH94_05065 [Oceanicaulis sp.]|uniref:Peptidase inhibitor I78 family protein n=1 Tax=Maricaulis virginensis TaxID=144022 RepID=A0A9W6IN29_9PROT|nr:I78 family peptidase inhibitor [Maricaulis virginensis]MAC39160.1 hypothetical protein [Oceanicaulis sp.]MAZ92060.1 hypothetical protein [Maricaulis sp.]MBI74954.1 hypothetical protein [Oceanicaulis sp.]GLK53343.1 hypothetical protein GCM10017621_28510 [Maricaulis virginensis]|tara:strand:+ start:181 stop:573 length:393 start_codon:yes stop_codon:yes gene_type:complete